MITAKEARSLVATYKNNQARIAKSLEKIDELVRAAAAKGEQFVYYTNESDAIQSVEECRQVYAEPTSFQQLIMDALTEKGFTVSLVPKDGPYVPRGLAINDGDGPMYITLYIKLSWYSEDSK